MGLRKLFVIYMEIFIIKINKQQYSHHATTGRCEKWKFTVIKGRKNNVNQKFSSFIYKIILSFL